MSVSSLSTHQLASNSNEITQEPQDSNVNGEHILQDKSLELGKVKVKKSNSITLSEQNLEKAQSLINLATQDLKFIAEASKKINLFDGQVVKKLEHANKELQILESLLKTAEESPSNDSIHHDVHKFRKRITKFKLQIPFKIKIADEKGGNKDDLFNDSSRGKLNQQRNAVLSNIVAKLFADDNFSITPASKDFLKIFDGLKIDVKLCLLCFSVFPENVIIRKRLMIYWWLAEGFLIPPPPGGKKTAEDLGDELFEKLIQKDFIVSAHKKRTLEVNSCKMHPFVRSALVVLAKEANFFDFDFKSEAIPKEVYSSSLRSCLVGKGLVMPENLHTVHTLFNINEDILDFKPEWFSKMKNVNVVYLGRWQATAKHHVEIDDPKILEGFKVMKHLKFLCLQGISRITKLPSGSIANLKSLIILDLRACHSLEEIPEEIGLLESLTHLDMSECYLLNSIPKELSCLVNLQVLKGFVVGTISKGKNVCTLEDLATLPDLRKLGIYTNIAEFPGKQEQTAFSKFKCLTKLGITWGSNQAKSEEHSTSKNERKGHEKKKVTNAATKGKDKEGEKKKEIKTATKGEVEGDDKKKETIAATEGQVEEGEKKKEIETATEGEVEGSEKKKEIETATEGEVEGSEKKKEIITATEGDVEGDEKNEIEAATEGDVEGDEKNEIEAATEGEVEGGEEKKAIKTATEGEVEGDEKNEIEAATEGDVEGDEKNEIEAATEGEVEGGEEKKAIKTATEGEVEGDETKKEISTATEGEVEGGEEKKAIKTATEGEVEGDETKKEISTATEGEFKGGEIKEIKFAAEGDVKGGEIKKMKTTTEGEVKGGEIKKEIKTATEGEVKGSEKKSVRSLVKSVTMKVLGTPELERPSRLFTQLEKLDLRCFPGKYVPGWLNPSDMPNLLKLYIRGGKLCVLGQYQEWKNQQIQRGDQWKVQALRLKYLSELRMDWKEVERVFPDLKYLEKLRCPQLSLFPCDMFGVWIDNKKAQSNYNKWHPEFALGNLISSTASSSD